MNAAARILVVLSIVLGSCGTRPAPRGDKPPRPPADLLISVLVLADEGADPAPALFIVEPGGQLRAATGAGAARDVLPPRTRRLTDPQVNQLYGTILRRGLTLTREPLNPGEPRIEVVVIAGDQRRVGVHRLDDHDARELVERCRRLARLDP